MFKYAPDYCFKTHLKNCEPYPVTHQMLVNLNLKFFMHPKANVNVH